MSTALFRFQFFDILFGPSYRRVVEFVLILESLIFCSSWNYLIVSVPDNSHWFSWICCAVSFEFSRSVLSCGVQCSDFCYSVRSEHTWVFSCIWKLQLPIRCHILCASRDKVNNFSVLSQSRAESHVMPTMRKEHKTFARNCIIIFILMQSLYLIATNDITRS